MRISRAPARNRPAPAPTRESAFDAERLKKAAQRAVVRLGPNQFRVEGSHQLSYDVNLDLDWPCDCADAQFHGRGCLHELAARLHAGDGRLIMALGHMLLEATKRKVK